MSQEVQVQVRQNSTLDVRAKSNMVLMLAGKLVSLFGTYLYNFAISLYVLRETGSGMSFAATLIFGILPRILIAPFAGAIADRLDRKKMVVGMDLASGAVVLGLWGVTLYSGLQVWYIYVAAVLLSLCNTFFGVALDASIPNLVDGKRLMKINSLNQGIASLTQIVAPMAGGIVYGVVDIKLFLLVNGLSFILSGISEFFIDFQLMVPEEARGQSAGKREISWDKIWGDLREGYQFLRKQELLFTLFAFAIVINFFFNTGLAVPLPYIINNVIKLSPGQFGLIEGTIPVGVLIGSLVLSTLPEFKRKYPLLKYGLLIMTLCLILVGVPAIPAVMALGQMTSFIFYSILGITMGFTNIFVNIPVGVMLQRETPDQYRGRVFGLVQTMAMATTPLGFLLAGVLIETVPAYVLPCVSGLIMLGLLGIILKNSSIKQI